MPAGVRRRPGAGAAGVVGRALPLLAWLALGLVGAGLLAAALAAALAGQRQPLQLAQVHPRQPHRRLEVLLVLALGLAVAAGAGLFRQQPVGLAGGLDLR